MAFSYGKEKATLLPQGYYEARIYDAESRLSKTSGNAMLKLTLEVEDPASEKPIRVYDYLVDVPGMLWKTEQFMSEVGLDPTAGEIDEGTLPGKRITVMLDIERSPGYAAKNQVKRYGVAKDDKPASGSQVPVKQPAPPEPDQPTTTEDDGDDIPF